MKPLDSSADPPDNKSRVEQAEARAEQAETRTEQAKTRIEQAETRIEQAETRTELAKTRAEQAEIRTERAETRTERAETRTERAESALERKADVETSSGQSASPPMRYPFSASGDDDANPLARLTERQRKILELIAAGQNTKQIADILRVSPKTVEYHRMKLMAGLNLHDIPGLVRFALRTGLVPQEN